MENNEAATASSPSTRGRGRGKSRGGLGKYLRARGRGRGRGRPAEFNQRLLLEGEQAVNLDEEEAKEYQRELEQKFGKRQLGSNADRYAEREPELDSEGEAIVEPEVDLSAFLDRQRLSPDASSAPVSVDDEDDVDTSLAHHGVRPQEAANLRKGKVQQVEWDKSLEELRQEKASADATRDLKARFRAHTANERIRAAANKSTGKTTQREKAYVLAPALPTDSPKPEKTEREGLQDFLDDLLG